MKFPSEAEPLAFFESYNKDAEAKWKKETEGKDIDNPCIDV